MHPDMCTIPPIKCKSAIPTVDCGVGTVVTGCPGRCRGGCSLCAGPGYLQHSCTQQYKHCHYLQTPSTAIM